MKNEVEKVKYRKLIRNGIMSYWKGSYAISGTKFKVRTKVSETKSNAASVTLYHTYGTSHVRQPSGGWRKDNPGTMYLYTGDRHLDRNGNLVKQMYPDADMKYVAAHEFAHFLGVGDAYDPKTRQPTGRPSMTDEWKKRVTNQDIRKVLTAFSTNKFQEWD